MSKERAKLSVCSFGLAAGLTWALGVFILGLHAMYVGTSEEMVELFGTIYIGYHATWSGVLIGTLWGFVDALVGGLIFAWIYNGINCCCAWCCKK